MEARRVLEELAEPINAHISGHEVLEVNSKSVSVCCRSCTNHVRTSNSSCLPQNAISVPQFGDTWHRTFHQHVSAVLQLEVSSSTQLSR